MSDLDSRLQQAEAEVTQLREDNNALSRTIQELKIKLQDTALRNMDLLNDIAIYGLTSINLDDARRQKRLAKERPKPLGLGLIELWQIERCRRRIVALGACVTESAGQAGVALHVVHKGCHHDTWLGVSGQRARIKHWRKALQITRTFHDRDREKAAKEMADA